MMKRDDGLDVARAQGRDDARIVRERFDIELTFAWLDAAPFDREPVRVVGTGARKVEILLV